MNKADKKGIVNIHGKEYMTVARRLEIAHEETAIKGIKTEVLQFDPVVVIRATVIIGDIEYQATSSANPAKAIEKSNPFEVAETSAVGRALGFAGYGLIESVATADDMRRATSVREENGLRYEKTEDAYDFPEDDQEATWVRCEECGAIAEEKKGMSKSSGKPWHGIFCSANKAHVKWIRD